MKYISKFLIAILTLAMPAFFVAPNITLAQTAAPLDVIDYTPSPLTSTMTIGQGRLISDDTSSLTVAVTVRNATEQALAERRVELSSDLTGVTFEPVTAYTNGSGVANFIIKSSKPGIAHILTKVNGATLFDTKYFVTVEQDVSPAKSLYENTSNFAPADGVSTITMTITALDESSNPVANRTVEIRPASATGALTFTASPGFSTKTNEAGVAKFYVKSTTAGGLYFMVLADGVVIKNDGYFNFTAVAGSPTAGTPAKVSASLSTVTKSSPTGAVLADGEHAASITVQVRDESGKAMYNKSVSLVSPSVYVKASSAQITNDAGYAYFTVRSTVSGTFEIGATADETTFNSKASIQFVKQMSASKSIFTVSPGTIKADNTDAATAEITIKDEDGNTLSGKDVSLSSVPSGLQMGAALVTTDATGKAIFTIKTVTAGTYTLKATVDSTVLSTQPTLTATGSGTTSTTVTAPTTVTASRASNFYSSFEAVPTLLPVGKTVSFILKLRDTTSAPMANRTVSFMVTTNGVLKAQNVTTDASGKGQLDITVTNPGVISTSVLVDEARFIATATVVAAASAADQPLPTATTTPTGAGLTITPTQETAGATIDEQPPVEESQLPEPKAGRMIWVSGTDTVIYKHPRTLKIYVFENAQQALDGLKMASSRIPNSTIMKIPGAAQNSKSYMATRRFYSGRCLMTANDNKRVWYVHPDTLKRYWFDGSAASYEFLKKLADKSE